MGWWSSVKNAVKKAWTKVKAVVRAIVRYVFEFVMRIVNIVPAILPVQKTIYIQVLVLRKENGDPVLQESDMPALLRALDYASKTFKDRFNIVLKPYGNPLVQTLPHPAPSSALNTSCNVPFLDKDEFNEAGEYYAKNLAGWNVIPLGFKFPISIFVVEDISDTVGCSRKELTDYVTVSVAGTKSQSTPAHELGHSCGLRHRDDVSNLMYKTDARDNQVTGWQKFVVRTSRHSSF